jgi:hypothetical protein
MNVLRLFLTFGAIALVVTAHAQVSTKTWRIGYIGTTPPSTPETRYLNEAFQQRLEEHGYTEGKNLVIERRYIEGKVDRFPEFAAELVRLNVDVIVVGPAPGVRAAKQATKVIPIVMNGTNDPIGNGFVASLGHPGGNITGIANLQVDLVPKRLERHSYARASGRPAHQPESHQLHPSPGTCRIRGSTADSHHGVCARGSCRGGLDVVRSEQRRSVSQPGRLHRQDLQGCEPK